ncbi:MAG: transposase [Clostridia bacterium]|nr:transposase [Clostridia bacterium]
MELPKRKQNRLKGYDYSQNGVYFLTVCIKDKECILGRIVGDGVLDVPQMILSDYGKIVENRIDEIQRTYENITIQNYVVMPNHVHLLILLYSDENVLKENVSKSVQNNEIAKLVSTMKRFINREIGFNIWQRSYHDHVVRTEAAYNTIWEYIDNNPARWREDCYNKE